MIIDNVIKDKLAYALRNSGDPERLEKCLFNFTPVIAMVSGACYNEFAVLL